MPSPAEQTPAPTPTPTPTPTPEVEPSSTLGLDAAAAAEPVADERFGMVVVTRCGGDGAATTEVSLSLLGEEDLTLDYLVSDDDGVTRRGQVSLTVDDGGAELPVSGLPVGSYHLDFFADGRDEPITVQPFEVLRCLVTDVQCRQLTLTNPATNPSVGVSWGEGPGELAELEDFDLEPGRSRVLRTDQGVIQWGAGTVLGGAGENFAVAGAGGGESDGGTPVPSDCGGASPSPAADDGPAAPSPGAGSDVGLADTGSSPSVAAALMGGALLTATGASVILRRRPG